MNADSRVRDQQTARQTGGVVLSPGHWASATVHAFREWTGESSLVTWCGIATDQADGSLLTTSLISCLQCGQASWRTLRG